MTDRNRLRPTPPPWVFSTPPPPAPPGPPDDPPPPGPPSGPPSRSAARRLAPPAPEDAIVFRESFLVYLEQAERVLLRALGDRAFRRVLESKAPRRRALSGGAPRRSGQPSREPWTHERVRALALDLGFVAEMFAEIGREAEHGDPEHPDECRLMAEAPEWAEKAAELVRAVEEALGQFSGRR